MTVLSDTKYTEFLKIFDMENISTKSFCPFVFYNKEGDCFEFYVSQNSYYSERIDDYLTVFLDMETNEIVGFMIKNVKRIVEMASSSKTAWSFIVDDGEVRLNALFVMILSNDRSHENKEILVREYKKVIEIAETNKIDKVSLRDFACV
ncbi:MAG: hypothetical protein LBC02_14740 [Planctomycetaceae bacterium]|jgi:hypothetical protein|nr:hypothetical protein [Planctomycetaceae bacterium]